MNKYKHVLKSKTIWGALLAIVGVFLGSDMNLCEASNHIDKIITSVGGILAIYGRLTANTRVTLKPVAEEEQP